MISGKQHRSATYWNVSSVPSCVSKHCLVFPLQMHLTWNFQVPVLPLVLKIGTISLCRSPAQCSEKTITHCSVGRRNLTSAFRLDESQGRIYHCYNAHAFLLNQGHHACLRSEFNFVFEWPLFPSTGGMTEEVSLPAWWTGVWLDDLLSKSTLGNGDRAAALSTTAVLLVFQKRIGIAFKSFI